ncbi:MAG: winged helix-turn-helix domain-containing protein, partial [Candidatus Sungbacteria bacterium]|nr:winged helix-turn-helix domain-containing protein [Candidatus Sungbacteria bacterium]
KTSHISSESREAKEQRRFKAAELFKKGIHQAEVARRLGVTPVAVHQWYHTWKKRGRNGLRSKGHPGFSSQLTDADRKKVKRAILHGAKKFGYETDLWTLERVGLVMKRVTGKSFGHSWIWQIVLSLGFTNQKPERRSRERDEGAIRAWKERTFPRLKKMGSETPVFTGLSG